MLPSQHAPTSLCRYTTATAAATAPAVTAAAAHFVMTNTCSTGHYADIASQVATHLTRPESARARVPRPATTVVVRQRASRPAHIGAFTDIRFHAGQGHLSRECTEPAKDKSCYNCGETGHLSRESDRKGKLFYVADIP